MTLSIVQSAQTDPGFASPSPITTVFASAQTAGNANVVVTGVGDGSVTNVVTDTEGNSYSLVRVQNDPLGPTQIAIYVAFNIKAASAGGNTVSVTVTPPTFFPFLMIFEVATTLGANQIAFATGLSAGNGDNGSTGTSGNTTLNVTDTGNIMLIGGWIPESGGETVGAGFTLIQDCVNAAALSEYQLVTGPSNYTVSGNGASGSWAITAAALIEVSAAGPAPNALFFGTD